MTKPQMLCVDDEPEQIMFMREFFEDTHDVHAASDVPSALKLIETNDFAVALVDCRMPGGSGLEILRKVAKTTPTCRRYLLSATDIHHAERAQEPPFVHICKGVSPEDLVRHVVSGATTDL